MAHLRCPFQICLICYGRLVHCGIMGPTVAVSLSRGVYISHIFHVRKTIQALVAIAKQLANANKMGFSLSIVFLSIFAFKLSMGSTILNCRRPYDCTAHENQLVSYFSRVSFFACAAKCQDEPLCEHFTFNMKRHGHYPGACYLFSSCSVQRPSDNQWVSAVKSCITTLLPRGIRGGAYRDRLQFVAQRR